MWICLGDNCVDLLACHSMFPDACSLANPADSATTGAAPNKANAANAKCPFCCWCEGLLAHKLMSVVWHVTTPEDPRCMADLTRNDQNPQHSHGPCRALPGNL